MKNDTGSFALMDDSITECFNGTPDQSCERLLMVGILGRAFHDLKASGIHRHYRRDAIKWFLSKDTSYIFSWHSIKLHVPLSAKLLQFIEETVAAERLNESERYNAPQQFKRKKGRAFTSPMAPRARHSVSPALPAVCG